MKLSDLDFPYPEHLVATERADVSRVMVVEGATVSPRELACARDLIPCFRSGDVLIVNDTKVIKRRIITQAGLEILFLSSDATGLEWEVLCPSSRWKDGEIQALPGGVEARLLTRGRPQRVRTSARLDARYFELNGELPLPPYIQKSRGERRNRASDAREYQTAWAEREGSLAAPTASFHFTSEDLRELEARGVQIERITLHVGLGTFLPVTADDLRDHQMHSEHADVSQSAWDAVTQARAGGRGRGRVWALGTTAVRALESVAHGRLPRAADGSGFCGATDIYILPGFEYKVVDCLLTNFHQPKSTLLALVAAFAPGGLEQAKACYEWAIEREFRLFSYGDLSAWIK